MNLLLPRKLFKRKLEKVFLVAGICFLFWSGNTVFAQTYYSSGTITSGNLLSGKGVSLITAFGYIATIPTGTTIKVQFSQDGTTWYNSAGEESGWDTLADGDHFLLENAIDISGFNWNKNYFYYQLQIDTTDASSTPYLTEMSLYYEDGPSLETYSATYANTSLATVNGEITGIEGGNATIRGFEYGLTEAPTWTVSENGDFGTGKFSLNISGLEPDTSYYYRAFATNPSATGYGEWLTFKTGKFYTSGTVTSGNMLTTTGVFTVAGFGYNATLYTGTSAKVQFSQDGTTWYNSAGEESGWDTLEDGDHTSETSAIDVSSLAWNKNSFYYKIWFETTDIEFSPKIENIEVFYSPGPSLETYDVTALTGNGNGTANGEITAISGGNATTRGFEYGLTETPTWTVSENGDFGAGTYSLSLTGLNPDTTYYIRAFATNPSATGHGEWVAFTTGHYSATGNIISTNLLSGTGAETLTGITYRASSIPSGSTLTAQISQNGSTWYNFKKESGQTSSLTEQTLSGSSSTSGEPTIVNLCDLNWTGVNFYYKAFFTRGTAGGTPILDDFSVLTDDSDFACKALGHWRFDEGAGATIGDSGAFPVSGSVSGVVAGQTWTTEGKFGRALVFSQANSTYATINLASYGANAGARGVCFWANPTSANEKILSFDSDAVSVEIVNSKVVVNGMDSTNKAIVYVNGQITRDVATGSGGGKDGDGWSHICVTGTTTLGTSSLVLGKVGSTYFNGRLDEIKLYSYPLGATEAVEAMARDFKVSYGKIGTNPVLGGETGLIGGAKSDSKIAEYCVPGDTTYCATPKNEWLFDDGSGNSATDTGKSGNTGSLAGGAGGRDGGTGPLWDSGKFGRSLKFDGVNDYVTSAASSSVKSLSFWIYTSNFSQKIMKLNGSSYIQVSSGNISWEGITGEKVYVNGVQSSSITANTWNFVTLTTDIAVSLSSPEIGRASDTEYFTGNLDSIRVYDYVRTAPQISWEYNKGASIAWYRFDECQDSVVHNAINTQTGGSKDATIYIGTDGTQILAGNCSTPGTAWGNGSSGFLNSSLNLDGHDDYAVTGNVFLVAENGQTYTSVSWGGWVNPQSVNSKTILEKEGEFRLVTNSSGVPACEIYSGSDWSGTSTSGVSALSTGDWAHLLCVYNGENLKLYINGELVVSQSKTSNITSSSGTPLFLGRNSLGSGYFGGKLDEIRVYPFALTLEQIKVMLNYGVSTRFN